MSILSVRHSHTSLKNVNVKPQPNRDTIIFLPPTKMPASNVNTTSLGHNLPFTGTYDPSDSNANPPSYNSAVGIPEFPPAYHRITNFDDTPILEERTEQISEIAYDCTEPLPIFPFTTNKVRRPPEHHNPYFADQWPIGFSNEEWPRVWGQREFNIDPYLNQSRTIRNGNNQLWSYEYDFKGTPYRLTIDHQLSPNTLPIFEHGMAISFQNSNTRNHRYFVDHCVHQDNRNAYLKVICYDYSQYWYDACSYRPPCILVIPLSHCNVRFHPNVAPITTSSMSRTRISRFACAWRHFFF